MFPNLNCRNKSMTMVQTLALNSKDNQQKKLYYVYTAIKIIKKKVKYK